MKNLGKHEFDEIFRAGLIAPDQQEVDEDWSLMKDRLQQQGNRNRVPLYMVFVSAIAAMLLLVFSVIFNSSEPAQEQALNSGNEKILDSKGIKADVLIESPKAQAGDRQITSMNAGIQQPELRDFNTFRSGVGVGQVQEIESQGNLKSAEPNLAVENGVPGEILNQPAILAVVEPNNSERLADETLAVNGNSIENEILPVNQAINSLDEAKNTAGVNTEPSNSKSNPEKSRFSLAINIAPDLNGVEQLQNNKVSYSLGAALIYKLSKKVSFEAGAAYGKKTYSTGFSSFRPASYNLFQVKPNVVSSGFDIMDIQLNLAYTMLSKGKSSVGLSAGLSSYLMLDEQYSFTYPNQNARGLSSFSTGYQNNHFFGIANLSLNYQRNLTSKVKLALNPYLKLPLTDLGYGNIRLRSAGMSLGVITNLNKSKKY